MRYLGSQNHGVSVMVDLDTLQTRGNTLLVHIPSGAKDTIWVGGRELYFDGTWEHERHRKLRGVIVGTPGRPNDEYLLQRRGLVPKNVPCSDIVDELRAGDVVYPFWTIKEASFAFDKLGDVYKVKYNQVVARVREGEVSPFGSYVFCREVYPPDVELVEVLGQKLRLRVAASGLTLGSEAVPPEPYQGVVVKLGQPLRGQPQNLRVGDRVVFDKRMCASDKLPLRMEIEGEEYLCIRQDYIEAVLEEVAPYVSHNDPGFDEWVRDLSDSQLEKYYLEAWSDKGNAIDREGREYYADRQHAFAEEMTWREHKR